MHKHTQRLLTGLATLGASLALVQSVQAQALKSNTPGAVMFERVLVKVNGA